MQGRWTVQVAAEMPKTAHTWRRWMPQRAWQEPPGVNENGQVGRWDFGKGKARAALSARKCHQRYMAICPVYSISTDKTVFLSLLAGETRLCPDKNPMLRRANAHQLPPGRGHCSTKARCSLCRRGAQRVGFAGGREVSDNERNNDLSCLVLLTGKVLFCLIVRVLSATAERQNLCPNSLATREMSTLLRAVISAGM